MTASGGRPDGEDGQGHDRRRALPARAQDRHRRHGRRLAGAGHRARPRRRDQDPARPLRPGHRVRRALPARGAVGRRAPAPERRRDLRPRRVRATRTSSRWSTWTARSSRSWSGAGWRPKDAIDFTRQILNAARFAHRKGIVHRDLKPQNVLIDDEGRARVADFGIARGGSSDITATGSVMGTAQYLSPEQAQGKETTPRSDIYSIGVILYEALTGRVPFEGDSAVAVALKQVSEQPRRPSAINPNVPPALDAVVMRALAKDPEARFKDADAFLKALDAAEQRPGRPAPRGHRGLRGGLARGRARGPGRRRRTRTEEERRRRAAGAGSSSPCWPRRRGAGRLRADAARRRWTVPNVIGAGRRTATELLETGGLRRATQAARPARRRGTPCSSRTRLAAAEQGGRGLDASRSASARARRSSQVPDVAGLTERRGHRDGSRRPASRCDPGSGFSDTVPKGRAIGTEPVAGTSAARAARP